ncbi:MAG: acetylxylan esterase [Bacteroidales bacterium]|nr:acetylxylan esterase [Bacteroidales bacterium]
MTTKRLLFTVIFSLFSTIVFADNYPYRSDYLFTTIPNHSNWLYQTGENAEIEVVFQHYGICETLECEYSIADDMMPHDNYKKITLKDGRGKIKMEGRKTSGFRDLEIKAKLKNGEIISHHIKLGFSVDKITAWTKEPADFKAFWDNVLSEQSKLPLRYSKELADEYCSDKFDCYLVKIPLLNKHAFYGYLFVPLSAKEGKKCPVVLCPPGAGIKTIKEPLKHRYYAENDMIRLEIDIHGLDPRLPEDKFKEISDAFNATNCGYLENGIENPDRYYMRHIYAGLVRCIDLLVSLPEWDGKNVAVQGGSQGGALSLICASLDSRVNLCVVNHPALSDMGAYSEKGLTGGYPHFNKSKVEFSKDNLRTMALYDVVNFSRYVKAKVFMTWGYNDNVCPPTTSYAVWNTLTCEKESFVTPINEHWTSDATEYGHMLWIKKNLK